MTPPPPAWPYAMPPTGGIDWRWSPMELSDLAGIRQDVRDHVAEHSPQETARDTAEVLVMALDELMSNALRHGRPPVTVQVRLDGTRWVLEVCDTDVDNPPTPDPDRDPIDGGMGLGIVATLSRSSGWYARDDGKHIWAVLEGA